MQFIIIPNMNMKYLGINLTKYAQGLYNENYNTVLR